MKINDKIMNYDISKHIANSTQQPQEMQGEKKFSDASKAQGKEPAAQDTIVNLSTALREAQAVKEMISSEPDVREEKVAELKERIESGSYRIDHMAVADKMVDSFLDEI